MDPSPPATGAAAAKEPHLPTLCRVGNLVAPRAPQNIADAGLEDRALADLAVKLACTTARSAETSTSGAIGCSAFSTACSSSTLAA